MVESPLIQEIVEESERAGQIKAIIRVLEARFGSASPAIGAGLQQIKEEKKLERLTRQADVCEDLAAFEKALAKELPTPVPPSTRGKKKPRKPAE